MTVVGSQFIPIVVSTLNPWCIGQGLKKNRYKKRIWLQSTTQKAIGRGPSILWGECRATPLIKGGSCPVFICTPAAISYINLIYIPPPLSLIPRAHISLSRTPARRVGKTLHCDNSQLSCNFHSPRYDKSQLLRYLLFALSRLMCSRVSAAEGTYENEPPRRRSQKKSPICLRAKAETEAELKIGNCYGI